MTTCTFRFLKLLTVVTVSAAAVFAVDWPMWRFNSNRTACTPEQLDEAALELHWKRQYSKPQAAWDNQQEVYCYGGEGEPVLNKLAYDIAYQPVVMGNTMYVASMNSDRLTAIDLETGKEKGHFYTDGPIRFAPVAIDGKVYVGCDDGYIYCINKWGKLVWKKRGGPKSRLVLGNDRMMSIWPVRGAPVIPTAEVTAPNPAYDYWLDGKSAPDADSYKINSGGDDNEELVSNGSLDASSSDLELGQEHPGELDYQIIGLRFTNEYYLIPQGAAIASASIQFTVDETKGGSDPLTVRIYGEKSGSSEEFSGGNLISARTKTDAFVEWTIPAWTTVGQEGADQLTPDLSAIVAEIVASADWEAGSPITFIIERVSGAGTRCAESINGNGVGPVLNLECAAMAESDHAKPEQHVTEINADTDVLYFAAGSYPFEGSFTYAVNKDNGEVIWLNDGSHMYFTDNPHGGSEGYSGNGPHGYLCTAKGNRLLIPNGRNRPCALDRMSGTLLYHEISRNHATKGAGGYFVSAMGDMFYTSGNEVGYSYDVSNGYINGYAPELMDEDHLQIKAGSTLFDGGRIYGYIDGDTDYAVNGGAFSYSFDTRPAGLLAANDHLIVTTDDGWIYCFGEGEAKGGANEYPYSTNEHKIGWEGKHADYVLNAANYKDGEKGVCVVTGLKNGKIMAALACKSDLTVVAFEPNQNKADKFRRYLDKCGLYGRKIHIIAKDFSEVDCPSYCARIVTSELGKEARHDETFVKEVFRVLRPYGGTAVMRLDANLVSQALADKENADIRGRGVVEIVKAGKLPGAADWNHQHCNVQQTTFSDDKLVKLPMGILWFGGSADNTNDKILPRHGHGPSPQVIGGRYFIEGLDVLRCVDNYTGRVLWEKEITNLGQYSNYTDHQAGQLALGDNYIATEDRVYVLGEHADNDWPTECYVLDAATGEELNRFRLPENEGWGMIAIYDYYLIATANPMLQDTRGYDNSGTPFAEGSGWIYQDSDPKVGVGGMGTWNGSTSERIYVLDRLNGGMLWSVDAENGFFHNSIVAGKNKLFVMDRINWDENDPIEDRMVGKRSGSAPRSGADDSFKAAKLTAYKIKNGKVVWEKTSDDAQLFGSWLAYSEKHDILVECQRHSRDYMEPHKGSRRMAAWQGKDGTLLWNELDRFYWGGPIMLNDDMIITQSGNDMGAVNLLTGEPYKVPSGLTGKPADFAGFKRYGCGTAIGSKNMMIFRSGNAGYYDLNTFSGTGNWGGFKTGCTINLMPANGLIVAPEYTRTCGCMYHFQTNCALIHREDVEQWSCNKNLGEQYAAEGGRMRNVGFNFGAVGDRVDDKGILWMEYPFGEQQAGYSYQVPVTIAIEGDDISYFRHHSQRVAGKGLQWVASSGVEGASSITIDMVKEGVAATEADAAAYDIELYFMEPDASKKRGDRVFSVAVNGFSTGPIDMAKKGSMKIITKKLKNVSIGEELKIDLASYSGKAILCGIGLKCKTPLDEITLNN